jgi:hypothetical protein
MQDSARRIKHRNENREESRVDQELRSNMGPSDGHEQDAEDRGIVASRAC